MKRNLVDLFVAKDRTTLFWFTMACGSILGSALWVKTVIADVRTKPQYVIMDSNGVYYLAPSVEFEKARDLHIAQTRLAMETLFSRGPRGLDFVPRMLTLFSKTTIDKVNVYTRQDSKVFAAEQRVQTIDEIKVSIDQIMPQGLAVTHATGRLTRSRTVQGQKKVEYLTVTAGFAWRINSRMADYGGFPTICIDLKAKDPVLEKP